MNTFRKPSLPTKSAVTALSPRSVTPGWKTDSSQARFFSPLSVDSFIKKSSFIYYTEDALRECKDKVVKLADTEGLTAHANSIKVRFED